MMEAKYTPEQLRAFYGKDYVEQYEQKSFDRLEYILDHIALKPTDVVADFACGNGMLLNLIHDRVAGYVGVDFSEEFIEASNRRKAAFGFDKATFVAASIQDFAAAHPARFDVGFALDFCEHVYDEDWLEISRAMFACLKPGGVLYVHTPNLDYFLEQFKDKGIMKQHEEHIAVRNAGQLNALAREAGFRVRRVQHIPHYLMMFRMLHPLGGLPGLGKYFKARILCEYEKPETATP